ncbi:MAG TPA: hypothetical protein ENL01_02710 [Chlorobaculum parvum]|uniref:PEP-CTERM protein-sorting domain-containing protein n=1 Tax=Chlorobaculum parvum TaxID=274539 RepID=A0A7C5DBZ0_9CHLB|nr:hypothetical protein [Chlorobaculum parvum]
MKSRAIIALLTATFFTTTANAEVITMNEITGDDPGLLNPYTTGLVEASGLSATGIGHGSGVTGNRGDDRYNAKNWSSNGLDTDDYFTFTIDANDGYQIDFTSFTYDSTTSGTGPTSFELRSSLDSFASTIGSPTANGTTTIDLSAAEFQNLTNPVEFRLYGYSASSNAGTFSVNRYEFDGNITATPEPQSLALIAVGTSLMLWMQRRPRKHMQNAG